jgi:hypothetical protein
MVWSLGERRFNVINYSLSPRQPSPIQIDRMAVVSGSFPLGRLLTRFEYSHIITLLPSLVDSFVFSSCLLNKQQHYIDVFVIAHGPALHELRLRKAQYKIPLWLPSPDSPCCPSP